MRIKDRIAIEKGITHTLEIDVRFSEVDSLQIVWHGNYVKYMEDGREDFGRRYGLSYLDVKANGYTIPIVKISCEYKNSLRYGDKATIKTTYIPCDAAKIIFVSHIYNQSNQLVAQGETVQVFVDDNDELALQCPPFFEQWKSEILK